MDRQPLIEHLCKLPVEELVDVLREVFGRRQPAPEEASFCRNHFFLGVATSQLDADELDEDPAEEWGPWWTSIVAYPDTSVWGESLGPDYGLCQEGTCITCGNTVVSNVKQAICPVCGTAVYLT
jgi:hypothetical protein